MARAGSFRLGVAVVAASLASMGTASISSPAHAVGAIGYSAPVFVDTVRAGGEPLVIQSNKFGDLVYSSHEGTTHLDRAGLTGPASLAGFFCPGALEPTLPQPCYQNHVWVWTSTDKGKTWTYRDEGTQYSGFSDPDLTQDAGGAIYDTGINLVNDALFSSQDGGVTWPHGTAQCHDGDRPWLAGGRAGEVFLATDTSQTNHTVFYSNNSGDSCLSNSPDNGAANTAVGIVDNGTWLGSGTYSGFGKLVYDPVDGSIIEPAQFKDPDGSFGVGISRLSDAASKFKTGTGAFVPEEVVRKTSIFSPFGAPEIMTMDSEQNLYFAWDTDDREASTTTNGCSPSQPNASGGPTPKPNHIMLEVGKHLSSGHWQWLPPISLESYGPAKIAGARVLWPWSVAGSPGNVSVVWYQMDQLVDPDCDIAASNGQPAPNVKTYIYEAHVTNALDPAARQVTVTNAAGRAIHQGGICDSGTTCFATGQDRRLGDYFANSVDGNGCVIIASGDTTTKDAVSGQERITSLPIFLSQNSGPSLTGKDCATGQPLSAATAAAPAPSPTAAPLPLTSGSGGNPGFSLLAALVVLAGGAAAGALRRSR